jgi:hypothetical protein
MVMLLSGAAVQAGVVVDPMTDASLYKPTAGIKPLAVESKDGRQALRMSFTCTSKGTLWITRTFAPHQDWSGYGILHWQLWTQSTGARSHLQVQLYDAHNNELQLRREFPASSYGRWLDMSWDFSQTRRSQGKNFDYSRIKLLIFSAWQDHYGHQQGDQVDYWISGVTRERSWERTGLGVAPATVPPTLDGRLDEPCWQNTPVAEQFYRPPGQKLPHSPTSVRLLWDAQHLYIGLEAHSELLNPVLQRLDDFAARVTQRDGPVFRDDCLEVFLATGGPAEGYVQLAVNALGTQYDGRMMDAKWNGEWQVACARQDGYWTAELAIPWRTLELEPRPGGVLRANFFRSDAQHNEASGWSPVLAHHSPDAFGDLYLLAQAPPVVVRSGRMPVMTVGDNLLTPTLLGRVGGEVRLRQAVTQQKRQQTSAVKVVVAAGEEKRPEARIKVTAPGEVVSIFSVIDAATDDLYYQSPTYQFTTSVVSLLQLQVTGEATVHNNQTVLEPDAQGNYQALLEQGPNVIGLEARSPLAVTLTAGETQLDGTAGWKQSPTAPADWLSPAFDDSQWPMAKVTNGRLDPAAGRYLRRVVAAGFTRLRALSDVNHIHLLTGAAQHIPVVVGSPLARPLAGAALVMMMPPGVTWVPWGDKKPYQPIGDFAGYETTTVPYQGEQWTRVELRWDTLAPLPTAANEEAWQSETRIRTIGLVLRATAPEPRQRKLLLWIEGEGGAVREVPREIPLTVHPAYRAKTPKNIELQLWHAFAVGNYGRDELAALMGTWAQAGYNSFVERTYAGDLYNPLLRASGLRIIAEWPKGGPILALRKPETAFQDFNQTHRGSVYTPLCPSWLTTEGKEAFAQAVTAILRTHEVLPDGLMWDMEFGPRAGCFCPRCLQRFSERFKITETVTRELIMEKYLDQWTDWLCQLWANVSGAYREGVRQALPGGKMYTYSGYQTADSRKHYAIDWSLMGRNCDVAVAGYGVNAQIIADTRAALGDTPLLGGVSYWQPNRDPNLKLQYLNLMTWGCAGTTQFHWSPMDGLDYLRVAQVATFLADHEQFFTEGGQAHDQVSGPPAGAARALRLGNRLLVVVLNGSTEARSFRVKVPGAMGPFPQYLQQTALTPAALTSAEGAEVRVEAHDFVAFVGPVTP